MMYSVVKTNEAFDIVENVNNTKIVLRAAEGKAKDICRKLNLGAGFNGFTPHYFSVFKGMDVEA